MRARKNFNLGIAALLAVSSSPLASAFSATRARLSGEEEEEEEEEEERPLSCPRGKRTKRNNKGVARKPRKQLGAAATTTEGAPSFARKEESSGEGGDLERGDAERTDEDDMD